MPYLYDLSTVVVEMVIEIKGCFLSMERRSKFEPRILRARRGNYLRRKELGTEELPKKGRPM